MNRVDLLTAALEKIRDSESDDALEYRIIAREALTMAEAYLSHGSQPGEIGRRVEIRATASINGQASSWSWLRYYVDYESSDSITLNNRVSGPLASSAVFRKRPDGLLINQAGQIWELREL